MFHGRSLGGERRPKASGQSLPPQVAEVGRAAPGTRRGLQATAKAEATATADYPWFGGAVSDCGDAASTSL
ncbi:hypothetical protein STRNTR1_0592 [Stenotrophomonas maltophilia]|nr:hypothetical protein STRNTR1_0592 [Stenotrophomonas maltophilia]